MKEPMAVNPEVLAWARQANHMSIQDACAAMNRGRVSNQTIERWESGQERPNYHQLERLAEIYDRPVAVFFFPEPINEETLPQSFRIDANSNLGELSADIHVMRREALAIRFNLEEIFDGVSPADSSILQSITLSSNGEITAVAAQVRQFLEVDMETQIGWKDAKIAVQEWRNTLEKNGIFTFMDSFSDDIVSGFCLHHDTFPMIYVNKSNPPVRQIFTMFHELAHLLYGKGSIDFSFGDNDALYSHEERKIEILCNKFAGQFLLPDEEFTELEHEIYPGINEDINYLQDDTMYMNLSNKYKVSRPVILNKLLDRNLINKEFYFAKMGQWVEKWKRDQELKRQEARAQREQGVITGAPDAHYWRKLAKFGMPYTTGVFKKYYNREINSLQLAEYLEIKAEQVTNMESVWAKRV